MRCFCPCNNSEKSKQYKPFDILDSKIAAFVVKIVYWSLRKKVKERQPTRSVRHVSILYFDSLTKSTDDLLNLNLKNSSNDLLKFTWQIPGADLTERGSSCAKLRLPFSFVSRFHLKSYLCIAKCTQQPEGMVNCAVPFEAEQWSTPALTAHHRREKRRRRALQPIIRQQKWHPVTMWVPT